MSTRQRIESRDGAHTQVIRNDPRPPTKVCQPTSTSGGVGETSSDWRFPSLGQRPCSVGGFPSYSKRDGAKQLCTRGKTQTRDPRDAPPTSSLFPDASCPAQRTSLFLPLLPLHPSSPIPTASALNSLKTTTTTSSNTSLLTYPPQGAAEAKKYTNGSWKTYVRSSRSPCSCARSSSFARSFVVRHRDNGHGLSTIRGSRGANVMSSIRVSLTRVF